MLITFSGLDGAGKSTLITSLRESLNGQGHKTVVLTMYDHVGLYPLIRFIRDGVKSCLRRVLGLAPQSQDFTNDPNRINLSQAKRGPLLRAAYAVVRSIWVKRIVLLADISAFIFYRILFEKIGGCIMIMDRYFFDTLADVSDGRNWRYVQGMLRVVSMPDFSVFVDVTPEVAYGRKGEYSVSYLNLRRLKYLYIFNRVPVSLSIRNDDFKQTTQYLLSALDQRMNGR